MSPCLYLKANTVLAAEKACWRLTGRVVMRILLLHPNYRFGETEIAGNWPPTWGAYLSGQHACQFELTIETT